MKKLLSFLAIVSIFAACKSYGDKYKVNDKSEIYFKDGMNADDAKRLGDFLVRNGYFDSTSSRSVQLTKAKDTINIKFVVDKAKVAEETGADALFTIMGSAIKTEVFASKPVKVVLADEYMAGFRDIVIP